jgi:uncharacterized OB-fold protein
VLNQSGANGEEVESGQEGQIVSVTVVDNNTAKASAGKDARKRTRQD